MVNLIKNGISMKLYRKNQALAFSDIILIPSYNTIQSRLETNLETRLTRNYKIGFPVVSTNMVSVTGEKMCLEMARLGSVGILNRFQGVDNKNDVASRIEYTNNVLDKMEGSITAISVGVKDEDYLLLKKLDILPCVIMIDIAHSDSSYVFEMLKYIKEKMPKSVDVIVGNVCTPEATKRFCKAGADAIRVSVGGGGACSTRTKTGFGRSTLQSIIDCSHVAKKYNIPVIGDGGFRWSGCVAKGLAGGMESCTLGTMLAGSSESDGEWVEESGKRYKRFMGSASKEFQEEYRDGLKPGTTAEGVLKLIPYAGTTEEVINDITGGIRSAMTYTGAKTIQEFQKKVRFETLSLGSIFESKYL